MTRARLEGETAKAKSVVSLERVAVLVSGGGVYWCGKAVIRRAGKAKRLFTLSLSATTTPTAFHVLHYHTYCCRLESTTQVKATAKARQLTVE